MADSGIPYFGWLELRGGVADMGNDSIRYHRIDWPGNQSFLDREECRFEQKDRFAT